MLTLETFETSSIEASLNGIFYLIFSLKLYRGMFSRILYKLPESNNNNSSSQLSAQLMSLIIIVIISALFWTVQKGSELYTTYFKVALLKCHTSCKLVVLLLCIYYTSVFKLQQHSVHFLLLSTFQTWSICVSHKSFLMEKKKRNKNWILFHLQSILEIKSFLHTFILDSKEYTWNQIYFYIYNYSV